MSPKNELHKKEEKKQESHLIKLSVVERGHTRKDLALEQLERSTTAGGDVAHLGGEARLLYRCYGVPAAHDGGAALGGDLCQGLGDREGAASERLVLEHAHGAVPHHGLALHKRKRAITAGRGGE